MGKIGFIGLGKLGLPYAEFLAERHHVCGYDRRRIDSDSVDVRETLSEVAQGCETIFVCVPTPHDRNYDGSVPSSALEPKDFNYTELCNVVRDISDEAQGPRNIIIVSTVLPGTIRRELLPLARGSELIYMPAFAAMGEVRAGLVSPDVSVAGVWSVGAADVVDSINALGISVEVTTWEEAESIKILYNTWISLKIAFANTVLDISNAVKHIDSDVVMYHLLQARRIISKKYLKPGMGDGGPCHPRDNIAMRYFSESNKLGYDLFGNIMQARDRQALNLAKFSMKFGSPVLVLGSSYKQGVSLRDGSYSMLVAEFLIAHGKLAGVVEPHEYLVAPDAEVVIVSYDDPEIASIPFKPGTIIIDPWRTLASRLNREDIRVVSYGMTR